MFIIWPLLTIFVASTAADQGIAIRGEHHALSFSTAQQLFFQMPKCGADCLLNAISKSPCGITDVGCSCTDVDVTAQSTQCVQATCTVQESLITKNITETMCGRPMRDQTNVIRGCGNGFLAALSIAYILRIASKVHLPDSVNIDSFNSMWWDDLIITFAMGAAAGICGMAYPISSPGLGNDVWVLQPQHITRFAKMFFIGELLYIAGLVLVKISMIFTYLRFFTSPTFRKVSFVIIGINLISGVVFVAVTILQCTPISYNWDKWDGLHHGSCWANFQALAWTSSASNIVFDLVVVGLPMPSVWQLKLNRRKKFLVVFMFGAGIFVTLISVLRLHVLVHYGTTQNPTWDYVHLANWSTLECCGGIVCASMPSIRNYVKRYHPKLVGHSTTDTGGHSTALGGPGITIRTESRFSQDYVQLSDLEKTHTPALPGPPNMAKKRYGSEDSLDGLRGGPGGSSSDYGARLERPGKFLPLHSNSNGTRSHAEV